MTQADGNVSFATYTTEQGRLIGYGITARHEVGAPDVVIGEHYLGICYSPMDDAGKRRDRTLEVLYYDQSVRLIAFGPASCTRDYLLVLRHRSE
jgi:hypothetical protein